MRKRNERKLAVAREAIEDLSAHDTSPRALEADLDILASALHDLPRRLTRIQRASSTVALCDILQEYVKAKLVSDHAVKACKALEELTDIADYDVPDQDEFATSAEGHITDLTDELKKLFDILEERAAEENA